MTGQTHEIRGPMVAFGVAALPPAPGRVDVICRRELAEHTAALCRQLHGHGHPSGCPTCQHLQAAPHHRARHARPPRGAHST